jgi:hypothetical protein
VRCDEVRHARWGRKLILTMRRSSLHRPSCQRTRLYGQVVNRADGQGARVQVRHRGPDREKTYQRVDDVFRSKDSHFLAVLRGEWARWVKRKESRQHERPAAYREGGPVQRQGVVVCLFRGAQLTGHGWFG